MIQSLVRIWARRLAPVAVATVGLGSAVVGQPAVQAVTMHPLVSDFEFLTSTETPPTNDQCHSRGRRCFGATAMQNAYDMTPLYAQGFTGKGRTIAIIDSFGSATIQNDLRVFNNAWGLKHMCGETDASGSATACTPGMPQFNVISFQGSPPAVAPPPSNGTGQEVHNLWALEVSLDVEWAHAIAPEANIDLVTTPTAETLGVQGFPDMMKAEQMIVDNHMADVISQSFGAGEDTFGSVQSLMNQRQAFEAARAAGVTVFASSGDGGTFNTFKEPVKNPDPIPGQSVIWPGSDPLVTAVGGTSVCLDETTGTAVDNVVPPAWCQAATGVRETTWQRWRKNSFGVLLKGGLSGGGFSRVFARPDFQNTLPAGSTAIDGMRGVPDVAWQADSRTGVLVYMTEPAVAGGSPGGLLCPPLSAGTPCSAGWFVVGGTSSSSPQWAGMIAVAAQMNGGPLGYLNPSLYKVALNHPADFHDITIGNNMDPFAENLDANGNPIRLGFNASTGWDPVTGLGSPDAALLLPDLINAVNGR